MKISRLVIAIVIALFLFGFLSLILSTGVFQVSSFISKDSEIKKENLSKREKIIAIHDEVMPKMGQLKSFEKSALQKSVELQNSESPDLAKIDSLKTLAAKLNQAYEGMFVWMRQYSTEDGEQTPEQVKAYLDEQFLLVNKVNENIKSALEEADGTLGN